MAVPAAPRTLPAMQASFADRLLVLRRMLWLVLFSTLTVLAGNAVLLGVPQARETLMAFEDGSDLSALWHFGVFCAAYLYWAFTAWFVARLMIGRCFVRDIVQPPEGTGAWTAACAEWIPRVLGVLATVPLAAVMVAQHVGYGLVMAGLAAAFIGFVIFRHRVSCLSDPQRKKGQSAYRYFKHMSPSTRRWLAGLFVASWGVFFAMWGWPVAVGRALGAPALLLVALGAWTLFGSIVLSYWPNTRGWWTLNWLPVLALALGTLVDNHPVAGAPRWRAGASDAEMARVAAAYAGDDWRQRRALLHEHFGRWMAQQAGGEPVYMVAVAGGASRAAYWAGMALGQLHDKAAADGRRFGENIYMLSGISGGSLGAAAFATALAAMPERGRVTERLDAMLGRDFLGPVVGMMLYPDLVQRLFPLLDKLHVADRSRGLEEAWAADWRAGVPAAAAAWWQQPIVQPYFDQPGRRLPSLLLNTVRLEDGQRMLQSNLAFDLPDAFDLLAAGFDTRQLTLAGAVHNSARFPYVSPPGRVRVVSDDAVWGHLGDGGYHEATGAASLADVIELLMGKGLIVRDAQGRLMACAAPGGSCTSPVVIVMLDNTPGPYGAAWRRDATGKPRDAEPLDLQPSWPANEVTAPPQGLVRAWTSNGTRADWRLSRLAGEHPGGYVELRFPLCPVERQPSMTWHLNAESRKLMKHAAAAGCPGAGPANLADQALVANLERLRGWIAGGPR